jgi:hypothetical protein
MMIEDSKDRRMKVLTNVRKNSYELTCYQRSFPIHCNAPATKTANDIVTK